MGRFSDGDVGGAVGGEYWKPADHIGELTLFVSPKAKSVAAFNPADGMIEVAEVRHVVVLDGTGEGDVYDDQTIFTVTGKQLAESAHAGRKIVVGRVEEGQGKPGQNPPLRLADPSPDEMRTGLAWAEENTVDGDDGMPYIQL